MAATVIINRLTGAGPTKTAVTSGNTRASTSDNPYTTETTNPIPIPGAGSVRSFWVVTRLETTVAPTGTVDNLRWYMDGANGFGTGVTMEVAQSTAYTQASGTAGSDGDELTDTNWSGGTLTPTDPANDNAFTYTVGAPLSVTGSTTTTEDFGNYVAYQITVASTASPGVVTAETVTWKYDET
jgi:hypothetical protein